MTFFAHGDSKLVHDAAVDAVELIFGKLTDQCQILIAYFKAKQRT